MLSSTNRLTSREDFQRVTKSSIRSRTRSLGGYLLREEGLAAPKIGFIVSFGGSVKRHRIIRKLRHASRGAISTLPTNSLVVVRAYKDDLDAGVEIPELFSSLTKKVTQ